jgi:phage tail protein X
MKKIISKDGDILDALCWHHYGRQDVVPAVLGANPHLAGLPPVLAAGVVIMLPDLPEPGTVSTVRIWS